METSQSRFVYLDNIRNVLVYNVVLLHILQVFAYPLVFWWPVIDKMGSSRYYETGILSMDVYLMPCLLFISALFIFPSLGKVTPLEYIKKRFMRLFVPVIVFLFCAGDMSFQLILTRLNSVAPSYLETFLNFWRFYFNMPGIYLLGSEKTMNAVTFNMQHAWFMSLLFFLTPAVVVLSLLFKRKRFEPRKADSKKKIFVTTILFAVLLGFVFAAVHVYYVAHHITYVAWLIVGKVMQFQVGKIWVLIPLFLLGLYVYQKDWLTRSDIGSWKMWGGMAVIFLLLYTLLSHAGILPVLEAITRAMEHNMLFADQTAVPAAAPSAKLAFLSTWFLMPPACIFLLMFFLSFAKRFFNTPNDVTTFCSKHSINVYILHFIPVLILQYSLLNVPVPSIFKVIFMMILIIPACLWLSHRLVYPYPKIAIGFFVALKLAALAAGFTFYYYALLVLIAVSFAGAAYESARYILSGRVAPEIINESGA